MQDLPHSVTTDIFAIAQCQRSDRMLCLARFRLGGGIGGRSPLMMAATKGRANRSATGRVGTELSDPSTNEKFGNVTEFLKQVKQHD